MIHPPRASRHSISGFSFGYPKDLLGLGALVFYLIGGFEYKFRCIGEFRNPIYVLSVLATTPSWTDGGKRLLFVVRQLASIACVRFIHGGLGSGIVVDNENLLVRNGLRMVAAKSTGATCRIDCTPANTDCSCMVLFSSITTRQQQ